MATITQEVPALIAEMGSWFRVPVEATDNTRLGHSSRIGQRVCLGKIATAKYQTMSIL